MGIQSLLPFLANSTRDAHISEFENEFVAVDAYCWLHKGIYSCAFELAMKKPTLKYVTYCMRYIEMLLHFKVKPILVFDGRHLSSKSETEKKRREERKKKYEKGKELMRVGRQSEGRKLLGESVDVSHKLALNLMKKCREKNIDCIVAPHEADAQLAFLSLKNVVKCVITEDSDLLAYGSERVMFKMDTSGRGRLIEKSEIHFSLNMTPEEFNEDIFRYLCILSGCDYLPSLPSIGPANSLKFIKMLKGNDIYDALPKLPLYINKMNVKVPPEYILGFKIADDTFKHQLVYDPFLRLQVPLRPAKNDDDIVGTKLPEDLAFNLAVGNIDPMTMKKVDNFDPDKAGTGFTILWKTDLLPNGVPGRSLVKSCPNLVEAKKRQRENLEHDTVQSVTNDLKKQRIPLNTANIKNFLSKNSNRTIPLNGFDFDPKISSEKKKVPNVTDKSKLLRSRYFSSDKGKQRDREIGSMCDKRKDESNEDYMERMLNEYFPLGGEEAERNEEGCRCATQDENKIPENFCSLCEKCHVCCSCLSVNRDTSDSQNLNECIANVKKVGENVVKEDHFLLDEINKTQTGQSKEDAVQGEEEEKSGNESPSRSLSLNFSEILSELNSVEKENEKTEPVIKENSEVVCDEDVEPLRSPSPVFRLRKGSRVLNNNSRLQNVVDTTGTPTSIYFSDSGSGSLSRSISQASSSVTPSTRNRQRTSEKGFNSAPPKEGRNPMKMSSACKTLFQFGFKKHLSFNPHSKSSQTSEVTPSPYSQGVQ